MGDGIVRGTMASTVSQSQVREEIEALHRFFVEWFSGVAPATDSVFETGFMRRFDEKFLLIPPAGAILDLSALATGIRSNHGTNPNFRIAIRGVTIRRAWDRYVLATYEEWQRNALASTPPDNGRIASVLFNSGASLRWLHVHETWLPTTVMEAGPYDF